MIIENPENLMAWMTTALGPLCDADPEALAKYIYALVKKHKKPIEELRSKLIAQLEVFLSKHTQAFVNLLIGKIKEENPVSGVPCDVKSIKLEPGLDASEESLNKTNEDSDDLLEAVGSSLGSSELDFDAEIEALNKEPAVTQPARVAEQLPQVVPAAVVQPLQEAEHSEPSDESIRLSSQEITIDASDEWSGEDEPTICPKYEYASTEDEHASTEDEHASTEDEHASTQDEHASTQDKHASTQDEPASIEVDRASTEDDNNSTEVEPVSTENEPVSTENEPVSSENDSASSEVQPANTENEPVMGLKSSIDSFECEDHSNSSEHYPPSSLESTPDENLNYGPLPNSPSSMNSLEECFQNLKIDSSLKFVLDYTEIITHSVNTYQEGKDLEELTVKEDVEKPNLFIPSNGSLSRPVERHNSASLSHDRRSDPDRDDRESFKDRDDRERSVREGRRRNSSGSPVRRSERSDRSRSRSWDRRLSRRSRSRSRRSRSRGRDRDRSRPFRNKSPPPPRTQKSYDRERRLRSYSKSPPGRSNSRSPLSKSRSRYRNRSPFTRSRSPYDSPRNVNASSPAQESSQEDDTRSQNQGMQSVVTKLVRCKDFDEKGLCMRGEMCPYDHGNDPVVLEDLGQVLSYSAPPGLNQVSSGLHMPPPPPGQNHYRAQVHANLAEYNPDDPSMEPRLWAKQPFRTAGRPMLRGGPAVGLARAPLYTAHQRELISLPVEQQGAQYFPTPAINQKKRHHPDYTSDMEGVPPMKQRFDYNRLGIRPRGGGGNCSLQLRKVPVGLNNIAHLHNHFVKFGRIVNIQIGYEGDPEAAIVTYTTNAEASVAYKSTEAVLNNRFIKVFWHDGDTTNKSETMLPLMSRTSAKDRLGAPVVNLALTNPQVLTIKENQENESQKVLFSGSNITKTVYIPTPLEKKPLAVAKPDPKKMLITTHNFFAAQEALAAKEALKKKEETRREGLKLTQNITNRKHDLLDNLLLHQKKLIDKLEKEEHTPEQKTEIMSTIQFLQDNIKTIHSDLKANVNASVLKPTTSAIKVTPQIVKISREETLKQILDAELDLFTQQQEGKDVSDLQKKVQELKTKEQSLNMLANSGILRLGRGGARYRAPRGRGFNPHTNLDHRPTKLLVSGFESDDKVEVLEHFSKFGEVVDQVWDEATPALVIQYKTRKEAENALTLGRNFQDRLMSITWYNPAQNMGMRSSSMRSVILLNESELLAGQEEEEEEMRNLEENEDFLLGDEEEDEDDDRTWRR